MGYAEGNEGSGVTDDPREVLKAAGVECAEVDEYCEDGMSNFMLHGGFSIRYIRESKSDAAILALALLVDKYKWQWAQCADELDRLRRKHNA